MGDIEVDIDWPEEEEDCIDGEDAPLLSVKKTHARKASYGSYLPRYSLDRSHLKRLLSSSTLPDPAVSPSTPPQVSPATKDSPFFAEPLYTRLEGAGARQEGAGLRSEDSHSSSCPRDQQGGEYRPPVSPIERRAASEVPPTFRRHCQRDSLIDSSIIYSDGSFVAECERQLIGLLDYVETHLKQVNDDLQQQRDKLKMNTHQSLLPISSLPPNNSVINEDPEDKDSIRSDADHSNSLPSDTTSIGGDSGIEDDHLTTPKGFLSRIKEVVESLVSSMETTVKQLDDMVGVYDERSHGNLGRSTLSRHLQRRNSLQEQLKDSLKKIDKELDNLYEQEERNVKITDTLNQAKKDRLGCLGLLSLCLLLVTIAFMSFLAGYFPSKRWVIVLRLLRSPLTIILFMFLFGFNVMAWSRFNIDFVRIFEFPIDSIPTPRVMFNMGSFFTFFFSLLSAVCFFSTDRYLFIMNKVIAAVMWSTLLLFLINPLKILYRSGRFSLVMVFVRIIMSPLPVVKFGDFWLADQLNSMVPLLLDVQFFLCYCGITSSWKNELDLKSCTVSGNGVRPIISCLPALWRFWQTLRCYQRTRKFAHLVNSVKYFTTFPVVVFAFIFTVTVKGESWKSLTFDRVGWIIIMWSISSVIHSLYTFFWDVKMDWGLFCFSKRMLLRPTLYYPKFVYVIAIIFDFIIRFACAIKLTLAIVYHYDSDIIYFALIIAELLRRWVWNFFRIEYEDILRRRHVY